MHPADNLSSPTEGDDDDDEDDDGGGCGAGEGGGGEEKEERYKNYLPPTRPRRRSLPRSKLRRRENRRKSY